MPEVANEDMWNAVIDFLAWVLESLAGAVGDWGLAIIVLTFIIRLALTPLSIKQIRSSARMSLMQPKIQEIQERYANDERRQAEELQKFYSENDFNMFAGCLPILLQMPVFFALFSVLKERIPEGATFFNILPSLGMSTADAIATMGFAGAWIFIFIDVLFGVLTFVPMMLTNANSSPEQRNQTLMMGAVMAVMMVWIGWNLPVGVLLYYDTSAAWGVIQQLVIARNVRNQVMAEEAARIANGPVQVDVVRKEKKARPRKKK